jgi:small subunit ribosomal protein S3
MTHVVHPYSQRLGIIRDWKSRWFVGNKEYANTLRSDILLRSFLDKRLKGSYVATVDMERGKDSFRIAIHTSRPGIVIGRSGEGVEKLKADILKEAKRKNIVMPKNFKLDIVEVVSPESSAAIVGQMVVEGIEKRLPFRRVLKSTVEKVMMNRDVKGVRIGLSGRLGGAEMARREEIRRGNVPLQTLRADVDFTKERANMTYGVIGVKVWIYRGMNFGGELNTVHKGSAQPKNDRDGRGARFPRRDDSRSRGPSRPPRAPGAAPVAPAAN